MYDTIGRANLKFLEGQNLDLLVESYSNATQIVKIRGFTKNEQIIGDHTTSSDRSLATSVIPLTDTPIALTAILAATGVKRGQCYVKVWLRFNGIPVALLGADYISDTGSIQWPGGVPLGSGEGRGFVRSITGTNPAAGAEISETVPTGAIWRLLAMTFTFVTDATVAARDVFLLFDDGATVFWQTTGGTSQNASDTRTYNTGFGFMLAGTAGGDRNIPTPPHLILPAGYRIRTSTSLLKAGDNYGAPQLLVEEWIRP